MSPNRLPTHIRIASLNAARKASAGCQELSELLNEVDIDIIGLQEIKSNGPLNIPGYSWIPGINANAMHASHQGIGILIKGKLKGLLTVVKRNTEHEILWLKLAGTRNASDTYVCVLYCPHVGHNSFRRRAFYADLLESCSKFAAIGEVLILGDFNARMAKSPATTPLMTTGRSSLNFYALPLRMAKTGLIDAY
jgi:exonuclease III